MVSTMLRRPASAAESRRQSTSSTNRKAGNENVQQAAVATPSRKRATSDGLPVILVTGFLGAGKTTAVNSLLKSRGSLRAAVFVNEFGEVDVDGEVIRARGTLERNRVLSLKDGCMCCGGKDDFEVVLREEFRDAQKELDLLIIETSGVSDPRPILASLEDIPNVYVERVVCVVDATTLTKEVFGASDTAQPQIAYSDILVLSKVDLLDAAATESENLEKRLIDQHQTASRSLNCAVRQPMIVRSSHGSLDLTTVRVAGGSSKRHRVTIHDVESTSHDTLNKWSVFTTRPFSRERFEAWVAALPDTMVRAKGLIHVKGESHQLLWHWAGGRSSALEKVDSGDHNGHLKTEGCSRGCEVVFMGHYGDPAFKPRDLEESLLRCVIGREH